MRILHLCETANAGVGRHVLDLAEGQGARGHDVTVVWSPSRAEPGFVARLRSLGSVRSRELEMKREVGLHDWRSYRHLRDFVRTSGPYDVLHGHSSKGGALVRLLPRRLPGSRIYTPNAFRTQDPALSLPSRLLYGLMEHVLGQRTDRIIAVSWHEVEHALSILGMEAAIMARVMNGAAPVAGLSRDEARTRMGLAESDVAIGFIGRFSHQKNPQRFAEAVRHAQQQCPAVRGVMIGDGELRAEAEASAGGADIRFLGWQDGPALIRGFDIFCMTSLYEGFPYTLLEAMHAGLPIVTTEIGGAREAVGDGRNGVLLPVYATAEQIGRELAALAGDPDRCRAFGKESLRRAKEHTLDRMVEDTLDVYRDTLPQEAAQ